MQAKEEESQFWEDPGFTFDEISEVLPDNEKPFLDRQLSDEQIEKLDEAQKRWRELGYLVLKNAIPHELIDRYCELRSKLNNKGGWSVECPYITYDEIKDITLYQPLTELMRHLIGEPMMMHLNLTGWVSTERNFHQDDYLNPPFVKGFYAAAWFALDDISKDSGPFEYVPGSHKWPWVRQHLLEKYYPGMTKDIEWPKKTEPAVVRALEDELRKSQAGIFQFEADKGDVLIWHGALVHRGSKPKNPDLERRALIAHYSGLDHRPDMISHMKPYTNKRAGASGLFANLPGARAIPADERVSI